jgi:hypothetical protein
MTRRLLVLTAAVLFILQISFSVYYSGKIIYENAEFEKNSNLYQQTTLIHQQLVYQLSNLTSLNHLSQNIPPNLQSIKSILDLSHE